MIDKYELIMKEQGENPVETDMSLPKVAIVVMPSPFLVPDGWNFVLKRPFEGVSYISTVLYNAGYPVKIIDVRASETPVEDVLKEIDDIDVLGVATFEDSFPLLQEICSKAKEKKPDLFILLGGSLVTSLVDVVMTNTACDAAVIGEGELSTLQFMEYYSQGKFNDFNEIKGLAYKDIEKNIVTNQPRGQISDLDNLPLMRLELWPDIKDKPQIDEVLISHSRGCPNNCAFCYRPVPRLREKSISKFKKEIEELKKRHGFKFVYFVDLTFVIKRERTLEICNVLKNIDVKWSCMTRVQFLDSELLSTMKDSGCKIILYGFESVDQDILNSINKQTTVEEIKGVVEITKSAGIEVGGLFIIGFPAETEKSLNNMVEFLKEMGSVARVKYLSAIPGTGVYRLALKEGIIKDELKHLEFLSKERGAVDDEFISFSQLPDKTLRDTYIDIYNMYITGLNENERK